MLLLDSEAISAVAHGPAIRRELVRGLIRRARDQHEDISTVAAILAEVIRGRPQDAAVFSVLSRERVDARSVDAEVAIRAGQLLDMADAGSELAVDAFLVAAADLAPSAVIATVDVDDLRRLAGPCPTVEVASINP
ncbi:MAG: hypothetical protein ACR2JF_06385 [Iamia sp.]